MRYLAGLLAALLIGGMASAADVAISALPAASALAGTEQIPCVQSATTKKCTPTQLNTFVTANAAALTGDVTTTTGSQATTLVQGQSLTGNLTSATAATVTSAGRALTIQAGPAGTTSGTGGALTLSGGTVSDGVAGSVTIKTQNSTGSATTRNGADISIAPGTGFLAGRGGRILGTAGAAGATGIGGGFVFTAGAGGSTSGNGGTLTFTSGGATNGTAGAVNLVAGSTITGTGGSLNFTPGAGSVAAGGINFTDVNAVTKVTMDGTSGAFRTNAAVLNCGYFISTPTTGNTVVILDATPTIVLNPAGTLSTLTVTMSAAPVDGQIERILTTQTITGLTVSPNGGQTISGAPTTMAATNGYAWQYIASLSTWVRLN